MAIDKKPFEYMRDCVKQAFNNGVSRGQEFKKMLHAIIVELKRLNYPPDEIKDLLAEWNERCEVVLPPNEQKRQLFGYVDWAFKRDTKQGCKSLRNYCIGENICQYRLRTSKTNREVTMNLPFDMKEAEQFLDERFKADGYPLTLTLKALRVYQIDKATGEIILVGFRTLSSVIRDKYGHNMPPMDVYRRIQTLISEGFIEQAVQGKGGTFKYESNGYRFLSWKPPNTTHINTMCNTKEEAEKKEDTHNV